MKLEPRLAVFLRRHGMADYDTLCRRADADPQWFWRAVMDFYGLHFFHPFDELVDTSAGQPFARWCVGGTTNLAFNCLVRPVEDSDPTHESIIWEGEDGQLRRLTHAELKSAVERAAGGFVSLGYGKGDVVGLYLPMVPETVIAFLAIVSIGAIALPMFSGFGVQAVVERLADAGAKVVISADYTLRRGKRIEMAEVVAAAVPSLSALRNVVVVERNPGATPTAAEVNGVPQLTWSQLSTIGAPHFSEPLDAETPAMIVYTSGTTGKPKGTVHTHCGFMTKVALDFGLILDLQRTDRLLWMSDMGWLTGPILAVAAPLIRATLVLVEGVPDYPEHGRLWKLVEQHHISFLGVAPTMIRAFMQHADAEYAKYDLSTLRVTAATGEPWTPEAWNWLRHDVCKGRVPLLNYSGGTEIGGGILAGTMLHPDMEPCAFAGPIPGMGAVVVDESGHHVPAGQVGELALSKPSIGLTRGFWRDRDRYLDTYWSKIPGLWVHGDFVSTDSAGNWYIHGRSDDTIKVSGKRTGPAEVEAALLSTGLVAEAAAVGVPDVVKGNAVVCVCVPTRGTRPDAAVDARLRQAVVESLGSSFRPKYILWVTDLPKTRTLKIMRRLVRAVLVGDPTGDLSGLVNPDSLADLTRHKTIG